MKILITGATGFIGQHLMRMLEGSSHSLGLLVRNKETAAYLPKDNASFIEADLRNFETVKEAVKKFAPEVCIHLAWEGIPDYSADISRQNLYYSIELVDFLARSTPCKKIIVTGSCYEYGKSQGECVESEPAVITSFFSWAKLSLYDYLLLLSPKFSLDVIWLRLFYVYGPGQRSDSLIPTIAHALLKGKKPQINNPLNANDFIYVEDVARAIKLALGKDVRSGIYNLGSATATPVLEICKIIENQLTGANYFPQHKFQKNLAKERICFKANIEKTKNILGWEPSTPLIMGIRRYIESLKRS